MYGFFYNRHNSPILLKLLAGCALINVFAAKQGECVQIEIPKEYTNVCSGYGSVDYTNKSIQLYNLDGCCPITANSTKQDLKELDAVSMSFCVDRTACFSIKRKNKWN